MSLGVAELLCETEIDNIDLVTTLADTHQEIVRFDIAMNEVAGVDVLDSRDLNIRTSGNKQEIRDKMLTN